MSRWLLVTQDLPPGFTGGVAAWAHDLARALHDEGEEVVLMGRSTGDTRRWDLSQPFKVVRMHGRSWGRWQGTWAGLHSIGRLGPETRVICATWPLARGLLPLVRATGARLAVAAHGSDLTRLEEAPAPLQKVDAAATCWLPVSAFLATELVRLGLTDSPAHVLPMPLAIPQHPYTGPRRGLVMVARLTPLKGLERTVALAQGLGMPLTVVGDGPARTRLQTTGGSVRLLGRLPRELALSHIARARGAVLLPRTDDDGTGAEGLGLCLLEAATLGTPSIGCDVGGVREALGPGLCLADPDRPDLEVVRRFLEDPSSGPQARQWVETHHGAEAAVAVLRSALE